MPITWIPVRGQGYCSKNKIIGRGQYINDNTCIMKKGIFNANGELHDNSGKLIDYSDSANVHIRQGVYNNGKENGVILEYVFAKSNWNDFLNNSVINSTRYTHSFSNGTWQSTSETKNNIAIMGEFSKTGDKWVGCGFCEH